MRQPVQQQCVGRMQIKLRLSAERIKWKVAEKVFAKSKPSKTGKEAAEWLKVGSSVRGV